MKRNISNEDILKVYGEHSKLIKKASSKYNKFLTEDELNQCEALGVWDALSRYSSIKGTKFTTYLWTSIFWRCAYEITKKKESIKFEEIPENYSYENQNSVDIISVKDAIRKFLSPYNQDLIYKYYFESKTLKQISEETNEKPEKIRNSLSKSIKTLRGVLKND